MQAAALSSLHSDLESRQQIRGSAGGLGFNAAEAKAAKKAEKKSKRVRGADDNRREFSSTSAGAVAAGHWDPWARPVAFEMKAKNTIVGGLYTMFVKGPTMGGTIPGSQIAMPAPAPSDDTDDRISKKVKKAEKRKEKKKDKKASNTDSDSKGAGAASPARGDIKPVTFNWEEEVVQRLKQVLVSVSATAAFRRLTRPSRLTCLSEPRVLSGCSAQLVIIKLHPPLHATAGAIAEDGG